MMGFAGCGWFERSKLAEHNVRQAVNDTTKGHKKTRPRGAVKASGACSICGPRKFSRGMWVLAQAMCVKFQKLLKQFCLIID